MATITTTTTMATTTPSKQANKQTNKQQTNIINNKPHHNKPHHNKPHHSNPHNHLPYRLSITFWRNINSSLLRANSHSIPFVTPTMADSLSCLLAGKALRRTRQIGARV
jgi:hypothetical protein